LRGKATQSNRFSKPATGAALPWWPWQNVVLYSADPSLNPGSGGYLCTMIQIDQVLLSDEVVEAKFVCDLAKCKGGCCEDGDAGAPVADEEMEIIRKNLEVILPYLTAEGRAELLRQGLFVQDGEFGWVTPVINGGICAYGFRDERGIIKCGIEAAYNDGKLDWKKPISCHLFPIRLNETDTYTMVNYEPREVLCKPACAFGKKLKVPVYQFLKEALVRKFGLEFYDTLHQLAVEHFDAAPEKKK
jgi:hypothetical protein